MTVECPHCNGPIQWVEVPDGHKASCPHCNRSFTMPKRSVTDVPDYFPKPFFRWEWLRYAVVILLVFIAGHYVSKFIYEAYGPSKASPMILSQIEKGMHYDKVVSILGSPNEIKSIASSSGHKVIKCVWREGTTNIIILLETDHVKSIGTSPNKK